MKVYIKLHSYIDIITNSSTEIYVSVDESSIKTLKTLIDRLLKGIGSDKTCDDLFEISINKWQADEWARNAMYESLYPMYENEIEILESCLTSDKNEKLPILEQISNLEKLSIKSNGLSVIEAYAEFYNEVDKGYYTDASKIDVKTKVDNKDLEESAKILGSLSNLFEMKAIYE